MSIKMTHPQINDNLVGCLQQNNSNYNLIKTRLHPQKYRSDDKFCQ